MLFKRALLASATIHILFFFNFYRTRIAFEEKKINQPVEWLENSEMDSVAKITKLKHHSKSQQSGAKLKGNNKKLSFADLKINIFGTDGDISTNPAFDGKPSDWSGYSPSLNTYFKMNIHETISMDNTFRSIWKHIDESLNLSQFTNKKSYVGDTIVELKLSAEGYLIGPVQIKNSSHQKVANYLLNFLTQKIDHSIKFLNPLKKEYILEFIFTIVSVQDQPENFIAHNKNSLHFLRLSSASSKDFIKRIPLGFANTPAGAVPMLDLIKVWSLVSEQFEE